MMSTGEVDLNKEEQEKRGKWERRRRASEPVIAKKKRGREGSRPFSNGADERREEP